MSLFSGTLFRALAKIGGGFLVASGVLNSDVAAQVAPHNPVYTTIAGLALSLGGTIFGLIRANKTKHLQNAVAATPTLPNVTTVETGKTTP